MLEIIAIVLSVLLLLTLVMFFLLKKVVQNINKQSKEYFTLKLQDYDDLVDEKEKKLDVLKKEEQNLIIEKNIKEEEKTSFAKENLVTSQKIPEYQIEDFFDKIKQIDEKFNVDNEKIIQYFIKNNVAEENAIYKELIKLKNTIHELGIYNIMTKSLEQEKLKDILENCSNELKQTLEKYGNFKEISIDELLSYIDIEIAKNDPTIVIEVGTKGVSYDNIYYNVKTVYNPKIYKGIIIRYKNKLYDYSLS